MGEEAEALRQETRGGLFIYERPVFPVHQRAHDAKKVSQGAGFVGRDTEG